jgi:TfoX/Sxy family transcriptional regulator of competence genes
MAYNELLADRVRHALKENKTSFEEKKMFGGLCFLVDEKMCLGIVKEELMVRIAPENQDEFLAEKGSRLMDFTNNSMKGFLFVTPEGVDMDDDLNRWVERCLEYNPRAKSSKSK